MPENRSEATKRYLMRTSQPNKHTSLEFLQFKRGQGVATNTIYSYAQALQAFDAFTKRPFDQVDGKHISEYFAHLADKASLAYRKTIAVRLRHFYRKWVYKDRKVPKSFWETFTITGRDDAKPQVPLTPDELDRLIAAAHNHHMRALISLLWDAGLRRSEACALNLESVVFDEHGAWIHIPTDGKNLKTGPRDIYVTRCIQALKDHIRFHPRADEPGAPLFYGLRKEYRHQRLNDQSLYYMVQNTADRAGIRPINPHLLRHTRATEAARAGWNEEQMRKFFGWAPGSSMPSTYTHLTAEDMRDRVLKDRQPSERRPDAAPVPPPRGPAEAPAGPKSPAYEQPDVDAEVAATLAAFLRRRNPSAPPGASTESP